MTECFKFENNKLIPSSYSEKGNWIHLTNPTSNEIENILNNIEVEDKEVFEDYLLSALDREEVSRLEADAGQVLILTNASFKETHESEHLRYSTIPLALILVPNHLVTVTLESQNFIEKIKKNRIKEFNPQKKVQASLLIIYQLASQYLIDLRIIDSFTTQMEKNLKTSTRNEYLFHLLALEKNLVYFTNSLKSNESVVKKITRISSIPIYEDDHDLIEDVLIELQQASEMTQINSMIIRSIRDAFTSIISNSLNDTLKVLASLTIILTIPTIIFSFYGMNTNFGSIVSNNIFVPFVIIFFALIITWVIYKIMKAKGMF